MLVGRDRERAALAGLLADARAGRSGVLAVVGEVGMGKTALLDDTADAARAAGMRVLRARGVQSEARIPFAGLLELLRPALDLLDRVPQPQREALEGALALRPARPQDRFAVGAATLTLLAAVADERPVLVLVDDAHWLDGSSADALLFALRRLVADAVTAVVAVREHEPSLLDGTDLRVLRLDGLDAAATGELLKVGSAGAVPPAGLVARLHAGTAGNPLAIVELAGNPAALAVPPGAAPLPVGTRLTQEYRARCATLPDRAQDLLVLVAASDTGDLTLLAKAAARAGLDIADLAPAEALGLLAVPELGSGDRFEFRHPLVRAAVYGAAAPDRRRALHRALADVLPDADADRRAWHLALAALGPDDGASSALEQAGRRARDRSAYEVASQAFHRSAGLATSRARRASLLLAAADTAWLAGLAGRAQELLDEASGGDAVIDVAVAVEHLRGHIATRLGRVGDAQRILVNGAALAAGADADAGRDRAVVMLAEAVNAAFYAGDASAMLDAAARIPALLGSLTSRRAAFFAASAQGMALIFGGEGGGQGAALLREAVALVEGSADLADDLKLLPWPAMGPLWLRESATGGSLLDRTLELARRHSVVGVLPFLLGHVGVGQAAGDRWAAAEANFAEAVTLARETEQRADLAFGLARWAWLQARQGRERECREHADDALRLASALGLGLTEIWAQTALGELALGLGDAAAAVDRFKAVQSALRARGVRDVDLAPEPELVQLYLRLGEADRAAACLADYEPRAVAKGQPWALARAARCRGLLADDDEIDQHLGAALAWHARTPDAYETARTRLAYGGRLRRGRQRVRAREQLRLAVAAFDQLGAAPWSAAARAELAATGETARRGESARTALTPQETQIALLLASGRTTREAAAALFLSPKTVEYHLRSVYRKLGIASRAELASAAASLTTLVPGPRQY